MVGLSLSGSLLIKRKATPTVIAHALTHTPTHTHTPSSPTDRVASSMWRTALRRHYPTLPTDGLVRLSRHQAAAARIGVPPPITRQASSAQHPACPCRLKDRLQGALVARSGSDPALAWYEAYAWLAAGVDYSGYALDAFERVRNLTEHSHDAELRLLHRRAGDRIADMRAHAKLGTGTALCGRIMDPESDESWPRPPVTTQNGLAPPPPPLAPPPSSADSAGCDDRASGRP